MTYYAGYTKDLPQLERATNEVNTCLELVEANLQNEYWQYRLASALSYEFFLRHPFTVSDCIEQAYMLCPDPLATVDDWAADPNEFELNPLQLGCSQEYIDSLPSILEHDNRGL